MIFISFKTTDVTGVFILTTARAILNKAETVPNNTDFFFLLRGGNS